MTTETKKAEKAPKAEPAPAVDQRPASQPHDRVVLPSGLGIKTR